MFFALPSIFFTVFHVVGVHVLPCLSLQTAEAWGSQRETDVTRLRAEPATETELLGLDSLQAS